jgi:hypothetical protein
VSTSSGSPFGRYSWPTFAFFPSVSFFFCIDRNRRAASSLARSNTSGDVFKLGVAVGVIGTFACLAIALKRVSQRPKYVRDLCSSDAVALRNKLALQVAQALARPAQRRLRIASLCRLDETINGIDQIMLRGFEGLATATFSSLAATGQWCLAPKLLDTVAYGTIGKPRSERHRSDSTVPKCHRLGRRPSPSSSLIEIPNKRIKLEFESINNLCVVHPSIVPNPTTTLPMSTLERMLNLRLAVPGGRSVTG